MTAPLVFGIDPSFRKFGVAAVDRSARAVTLAYHDAGGYSRQWPDVAMWARKVVGLATADIPAESIISIESPISHAEQAGPELACLQGILFATLQARRCRLEYHPPHTLDCLIGHPEDRRRQKKDSVIFARRRLDLLASAGWRIEGDWAKSAEKGADDRAEAMIYACLLLDRIGWEG